MRTALENNEFQLFYQPKVKSENGEIAGVEALIRWQSSEFGNVSPSLFIPIVEKNGLIIELTEWVMMTACRQMKSWREEGVRIEKVAVNISAVLFHYHDLIGMVERVLKETKLSPSMLELEITETGLMENIENAILTLENLQKMGVSIALDDFGTGISSLTYLKELPLNTSKIDKSFIDGIPINEKDTAIMETILKLAENLDLTVVAEGVEEAEQVEFLKRKTCHYIQGYFFGRPLPPDEVKQLYGEKQASDFIIVTN
nr:EAL domain-containing protein [Bacillus taeanensis]